MSYESAKYDHLFRGPQSLERVLMSLPKGAELYLRKPRRGGLYHTAVVFFKSKGRTGAGDRRYLQDRLKHESIMIDMNKSIPRRYYGHR